MPSLEPIALVRVRDGVRALCIVEHPLSTPSVEDTSTIPPTVTWRAVPIEESSLRTTRELVRVRAAWRALAQAELDTDALVSVLTVALLTATASRDTAERPPPLPAPASPARATATHPRAFRGTKWKPPKPKTGGRVDLRPYLSSRDGLRAGRERLATYERSALERLGTSGFDEKRLATLSKDDDPFDA